jgi:hypothetical protein
MKSKPPGQSFRKWSLACGLILASIIPSPSFAQISQPVISSIRLERTNVTVAVSVPRDICRVVLESRARFGGGTWEPVAVAQSDGAGGTITFRLPCARQSELLRVRADTSLPLPAAFYGGTNAFWGLDTNSAAVAGWRGGALDTAGPNASPGTSTREVVESDIWQLSGDTLYFFNQYRGLQVIDIAKPDAASVRGTLPLPAAGEQMYLAGSNHVVLLARNDCSQNTDNSQVVVVRVSGGLPQIVTQLPVPGWIQESRMVGTALYVASQAYRPVPGTSNSTWEWGTLVSAFDLADPAVPVAKGSLWYAGYGNVVTATDNYLFVATQDPANWWQSVLRIIDITAPDGTMADYASLRMAGRLPDKFKLNYVGWILTTISEDWHLTRLVTRLETFRLPDPRSAGPTAIVKLGELELGNGEQLHATRFDGTRAYIVTFLRIDPLWVVDLTDPAAPHVAGAVDVPGWSTYILPLGPRLVTLGVESNRVAVSLFDVHDPAYPGLLSRVRLGQNYSWSEANNDEKAFTVLTDAGLMLVPYNGDTTNGWTSQVQLIDLNPTTLVARGVIQHQTQPRRATLSHNRILSLSGWEVLSVDATDRDHPIVRGDAELAWPVDRVFLQGPFLLEIADSTAWWGRPDQSSVRVAPADQPGQLLGELSVGALPIVGVDIKGNKLYLAQSCWSAYPLPLDASNPAVEPPNVVVTIVDLGSLPVLSILGKVSVPVDPPGWGGSWQPVWPKPGVLVWVGSYFNYWWWGPYLDLRGGPAIGGTIMPWPMGGLGSGQLLAFDVSTPTQPKLVSEVNLATNNWWGFSQPFVSDTRVYLSHNAADYPPAGTDPSATWVQRSYLDVIDYADPLSPTLRKPVNIPGTLEGLSHAGELLYTVGYHWTSKQYGDWQEWLDASAYNGAEVHLVDSLALPQAWPHPVQVVETNIFIGCPGYNYTDTNVVAHVLEAWTLPGSGKFTLLGSAKLNMPASNLITGGGLLALQETDSSVDLFDIQSPANLLPIGRGRPPGCLWFNLDRSDGALTRGLWVPLGMYGADHIPLAR